MKRCADEQKHFSASDGIPYQLGTPGATKKYLGIMSTFFFDDELQRHLIKLKIQFNHMEKK